MRISKKVKIKSILKNILYRIALRKNKKFIIYDLIYTLKKVRQKWYERN